MFYRLIQLACLSGFLFGVNSVLAQPSSKDVYHQTTTVYSDGSTLTLGGYGNPADYSFNQDDGYESDGSMSIDNPDYSFSSKYNKPETKEERYHKFETGQAYTLTACVDCEGEKKTQRAYDKLIELVNAAKYGEALDWAQYNVNPKHLAGYPDSLTEYRYYGALNYSRRQCKLKFPNSRMIYIQDECLGHIESWAEDQLKSDLKGRGDDPAFAFAAYEAANMYDKAATALTAMKQKGIPVSDEKVLNVELHAQSPNKDTVVNTLHRIVTKKMATVTANANDAAGLAKRSVDESALGSFFIEVLYNLTQADPAVRKNMLSELGVVQKEFSGAFVTDIGKERVALSKRYLDDMAL